MSEFKELYMGDLPQPQEANLATLKQLNEQLRLNSDTQTRISDRRAMLAKQLAEVEGYRAAGGPDATATRIAQLHQELTELRTRFSAKYQDVIRLQAEIAALEERLRRSKRDKKPGKAEEPAVPASPYVFQLKETISGVVAPHSTVVRFACKANGGSDILLVVCSQAKPGGRSWTPPSSSAPIWSAPPEAKPARALFASTRARTSGSSARRAIRRSRLQQARRCLACGPRPRR